MKRGWLVVPGVGVALATWLALAPSVAARPTQAGADNPHGALAIDCARCHTSTAWTPLASPLEFDHAETGFPLEDAHGGPDCRSCHESLVFSHVPAACADCHADPHRAELGFRCEACHLPVTWTNQRSARDRHAATLFPLIGQHANVDCGACHRNQQPHEYVLTPLGCEGCHAQAYEQATDPDHVRAGFPRECDGCHLVLASGWHDVSYTHPPSFVLRGAHVSASCEGCHAETFAGTPTDCVACHRADYESTRDPDHVAAGFPTRCDDCHSETAWRPATAIDHDLTRFPLTGAHRGLDCNACHSAGFAGTPTDCVACHRADYDGTRDPNHAAAGFPTDCEACHSTSAWRPANGIDHDRTRFPLTGAHRNLDCNACHSAGFAGTPTDCVACHRSDYDGTRDPNHAAAGFPTDCEACHSTSAWRPASGIDHDRTRFPLTGAHRGLDCSACHSDGFAGTPTECVACHRSDYDGTRDPNHAAAGFPTDCEACHSTRAWRPADFDHDRFFPIYSGRHRGEWSECSDCHVNPGNFRVFECTGCHAHSRAEMDDEHDEVPGYSYDSPSCYRCHPRGEAEDD